MSGLGRDITKSYARSDSHIVFQNATSADCFGKPSAACPVLALLTVGTVPIELSGEMYYEKR